MSDVLGVVATAVDTGGLNNALLQGLIDGRVKAHLDSYAIQGDEASASTITLGKVVPSGANVIGIILTVDTAQTSLTASVGDSASATRYGNALTSLQTAGAYLIPGNNYVVGTASGDNQIVITTGGATATAGNLYIAILYTFD